MKKLIASLVVIAAPVAASVAVPATSAHAASKVQINAGVCRQALDPQDRHYMAPGVSGNGPLVFVGGNPGSTNGNGFEGWVGCYK